MLHFFGDYKLPEVTSDPRAGVNPPYSLKEFLTALTTPNWGAEYCNYIGIPLIILFFFAFIFGIRANRAVLFTSLSFLLLTVRFDGFSLFHIIRKFPVLSTQRAPQIFCYGYFWTGTVKCYSPNPFSTKSEKLKNWVYNF